MNKAIRLTFDYLGVAPPAFATLVSSVSGREVKGGIALEDCWLRNDQDSISSCERAL